MVFGRWLCCRRGELGSRTGETASEGERGVGREGVEGGQPFSACSGNPLKMEQCQHGFQVNRMSEQKFAE